MVEEAYKSLISQKSYLNLGGLTFSIHLSSQRQMEIPDQIEIKLLWKYERSLTTHRLHRVSHIFKSQIEYASEIFHYPCLNTAIHHPNFYSHQKKPCQDFGLVLSTFPCMQSLRLVSKPLSIFGLGFQMDHASNSKHLITSILVFVQSGY